MIFEEVKVQRAEPTLARLGRARSATSLAGEMLTGTRTTKDWDNARDLKGRGDRLMTHKTRRKSSKDGAHYIGASIEGPFVRGPRREPLEAPAEHLSWHEQCVKNIFANLDSKGLGYVSFEKLQESFEMMRVPLDDEVFEQYALPLRETGTGAVSAQQFLDFHKAVWSNQPAAVRHNAGCPRAFGRSAAEVDAVERPSSSQSKGSKEDNTGLASSASGTALKSSFPSGIALPDVSVRDVRDVEGQLRRTYRMHASPKAPYLLPFDKLPDLLKDLGMANGMLMDVEAQARRLFNTADADNDGQLSFHEFVEFQNRYLASLETLRGGGFADAFRVTASAGQLRA